MNKIILATILSVILLTTPFASVSAQSPEKSDKSKKSESKAIPLSQLRTFLPLERSDDLSFIIDEGDFPGSSGGYSLTSIDKRGIGLLISIVTFDKGIINLDNMASIGKTISSYEVTNTNGYCIEKRVTRDGYDYDGYTCGLGDLGLIVFSSFGSYSENIKKSQLFLDYVLDKYGKYYSKTVKVSYDKPISLNFDKAKPATSESKSKPATSESKSKPATSESKSKPATSGSKSNTSVKSKPVNAKSFLAYPNNLSKDYVLNTELTEAFRKIDPLIAGSEQNVFTFKGEYNIVAEVRPKKNDLIKTENLESIKKTVMSNAEDSKIVFALPSDLGYCESRKSNVFYTIDCSVFGWFFSSFSGSSADSNYQIMDVMLKKYYAYKGKEFKTSTKELEKKGTNIPKKELSYNEKINSLVRVDIISCKPLEYGNYIKWQGSVTSLANQPIDVYIVLTGVTRNGEISVFAKELILDLYPGQTEYIDRMLEDSYDIEKCGYKIERIEPSQ